jgi:hypothetical protein
MLSVVKGASTPKPSRSLFRIEYTDPLKASSRGDAHRAGGTGNFAVVVGGSRIKAGALEPDVIAQIAEGLIIEDEFGGPALEVPSGGAARRAPNKNLRCPPADPYGNRARRVGELQVGHAGPL